MKIIVLMTIVSVLLSSEEHAPKSWNHAIGNENNFEVLAVDFQVDHLWRIDLKTGIVYDIGPLGIDIDCIGLDFDEKGKLWAYATLNSKKNINNQVLGTIDSNTGKFTTVHTFNNVRRIVRSRTVGFEFTQNRKRLLMCNTSGLFEINWDMKNQKLKDGDPITRLKTFKMGCGSWCMTRSQSDMHIVTIGKELFQNLSVDSYDTTTILKTETTEIPALARTPGGRYYMFDFSGRVYVLPSVKSKPVFMGQMSKIIYGAAINPTPKIDRKIRINADKANLDWDIDPDASKVNEEFIGTPINTYTLAAVKVYAQ